MVDLELLLQKYFSENKLMQLATVADGKPWLCNVYFVTDEENNIYWTSAKAKRRHSVDIVNNPLVAATIVHDEDNKQALQITGKARIVSPGDAERVDKLYGEKFGHKDSRLKEVLENLPEGRAYWVLKPEEIYFWDEVNFPGDAKQKYSLV